MRGNIHPRKAELLKTIVKLANRIPIKHKQVQAPLLIAKLVRQIPVPHREAMQSKIASATSGTLDLMEARARRVSLANTK